MALPTLGEMIDEVRDIIKDVSFHVAGVSAQGTITLSGLPSADETFVIHEQTFTFKAARSTAGEVTIGVDADACVANIETAIDTDLAGIVTSTANTTTDTVVVTSVRAGTAWDGMVFTEDATNVAMDGSGTLGGTTAGVWGDHITRMLNDGFKEIAEEYALPLLRTDSDVTTSTTESYVDVPSDFDREFDFCYSTTNEEEIDIWPSLQDLYREYTGGIDEAGDVEAVAIQGAYLHYQKLPASEETLKLFYLKLITEMTGLDDVPTGLPVNVAKNVLVNYAVWKIFSLIEEDIDSAKTQTTHYANQYAFYLGLLSEAIKAVSIPTHRPVPKGHWI